MYNVHVSPQHTICSRYSISIKKKIFSIKKLLFVSSKHFRRKLQKNLGTDGLKSRYPMISKTGKTVSVGLEIFDFCLVTCTVLWQLNIAYTVQQYTSGLQFLNGCICLNNFRIVEVAYTVKCNCTYATGIKLMKLECILKPSKFTWE